jgi:hypothetical protein
MLAPDLAQLGEMPLEQRPVELALRVEVFVDDRCGHPRPAGDLLDRGAAVAALGEQVGGGALDQLAARGSRQSAPRLLSPRLR